MRYRYMLFPQGKTKALTLSYDDGCIYDIRLAEILERFGIKATFNLNGMAFDGEVYSVKPGETLELRQ